MSSLAAKKVAQDVLESVGKGKRPILRNIMKKNGYAQNTADSPKQVTNTKSYKGVLAPVVLRMEKERERIMSALEGKDLTEERYHDLIDGLDKITKNVQLLTGGSTENIAVKPISEVFTNGIQDSKQHKEDSPTEEED